MFRSITATLTLAAVLLAQLGTPALAASSDERIRAYEQQLERMQREMDEMRQRLRSLEEERRAEPPAPAATAPATAGDAQDQKIDVLAEEVERIKSQLVLPQVREYKSFYGLGPAASKVYQVDRGLSIGGYGEFNFQKFVSDQRGRRDQFDLLRLVLYTGYKFSDRIVLNTEIEFEHSFIGQDTVSSPSGEVAVEFAYLDFFLWEPLNVRAGLLLVPMGFINEIHEPPFFHGNIRPEVERLIIPTTWREGGVGIFGTLAPGLDYRAYVMNGLNAEGFSSSGIRDARQRGNRALADDLAGVVRIDYTPFPGTKFGASFWAGDSGQDGDFAGQKPSVFTLLWEIHGQVHYRGLETRVLAAFLNIGDADVVSQALERTVADDMFGFYAEAAYDVLPHILPETTHYLAPFFRYEIFDTQDDVPVGFERQPGNDVKLYTVGLSYKPHPQVVLKLDYRNFNAGHERPRPDEVNVGAGFIF
jgi:hypothetical protein